MARVNRRNVLRTIQARGGQLDRCLQEAAEAMRDQAADTIWPNVWIDPSTHTGEYLAAFFAKRAAGSELPSGVGVGWWFGNSDRKANWIEYGTGIYGPFATPITPVNGALLTFKIAGVNRWVSTRSVRGRPATPVLTASAAQWVGANRGATFELEAAAPVEGRTSVPDRVVVI